MTCMKILLIPSLLFFYFTYMRYGFKFIVLPIINSTLDYANDRSNHIYYEYTDMTLILLFMLYGVLIVSLIIPYLAIMVLIKKIFFNAK